jgi:hypothetical protein
LDSCHSSADIERQHPVLKSRIAGNLDRQLAFVHGNSMLPTGRRKADAQQMWRSALSHSDQACSRSSQACRVQRLICAPIARRRWRQASVVDADVKLTQAADFRCPTLLVGRRALHNGFGFFGLGQSKPAAWVNRWSATTPKGRRPLQLGQKKPLKRNFYATLKTGKQK